MKHTGHSISPASHLMLSVCLIVKNEAAMLADCLRSVADIADEVIVVDTGSTDGTPLLAQNFGCRLGHFVWCDDFAAARNHALGLARAEWVLSIDADERLRNPAMLRSLIEEAPPETGGFTLMLSSTVGRADGGTDTYRANVCRLFRRREQIRFAGAVHEQIGGTVRRAGFRIESSDVILEHLGYHNGPEVLERKSRRNLAILDKALAHATGDGYLLFQRAKTLMSLHRDSEALHGFGLALQSLDNPNLIVQAHNLCATLHFRQGAMDAALHRARQSLELREQQVFANYICGEVYSELADYPRALAHYGTIAKPASAPGGQHEFDDYVLPPAELYFRIGRCLLLLGKEQEAYSAFRIGLQSDSSHIACRVGLADTARRQKDFGTAATMLREALALAPERADLHEFLRIVEQTMEVRNKSETSAAAHANDDTTLPSLAGLAELADALEAGVPGSLPALSKIGAAPAAAVPARKGPLISLSMIIKNEEAQLPGCLQSVRGIVDEIVINDTGSSDASKAIARDYGATLIESVWNNDFAAARNESLKHCTGQWVLYLDADERLKPEQGAYLRALLEAAPQDIGAFVCTIVSPHLQSDGGTRTHIGGYPRVFRNYGYPRIYFRGRVHEQISPSILELGKGIDRSELEIHHLGYDTSREVLEQKMKRNYSLLLQHVKEEPENAYAWFQLGQTLALMQLQQEAENALKFSLQIGSLPRHVAASCAATLGQIAGISRRYEDALHWAELSLRNVPEQVCAANLKAYALLHLGRFAEARLMFEEALQRLQHRQGTPQTAFDVEIAPETIQEGLAMARAERLPGAQ